MVTLAHISDPHVGSPYFVPNLMNRVIVELNELAPDAVICSGDLTNEGYRQEFKNWIAYAERIQAPIHTVPGNHHTVLLEPHVQAVAERIGLCLADARRRLTCQAC